MEQLQLPFKVGETLEQKAERLYEELMVIRERSFGHRNWSYLTPQVFLSILKRGCDIIIQPENNFIDWRTIKMEE